MRSLLLTPILVLAACTGTEAPDTDVTAEAEQIEQITETASTEVLSAQAPSNQTPAIPTLDQIAEPVLEVQSVTPDIDVLMNQGGNVAVLYANGGALLVDDKFARNADEILARVNARDGALPVYVLNTHYHGDHSGSNAAMKAAGATIVAHKSSRALMGQSIENQLFGRTVEARDPADFPDLTHADGMEIHFGEETVELIYTPNAHTGGDTIVYFQDADVLHMGDNFFNGMFPYIDVDSGGSLQGMIDSHNVALDLAGADTTIIPGHGPVTDSAGLTAARDLLITVRDRMQARVDAGDTLEEVLSADIYDDLGMDDGFINQENIARIAYRSLGEGE